MSLGLNHFCQEDCHCNAVTHMAYFRIRRGWIKAISCISAKVSDISDEDAQLSLHSAVLENLTKYLSFLFTLSSFVCCTLNATAQGQSSPYRELHLYINLRAQVKAGEV